MPSDPIVAALVEILEALVAMSVSFEVMLVLLVLMLDSTSVKLPTAKVPEIMASPENVAAPLTANVSESVVAPVTPRVLDKAVAPVTVASPSTLKSLRVVTVPEV